MKYINNYNKFEYLLEAYIKFMPNFKNIVKEIDLPISKKLLSVSDKDIDVNTNYIDVDIKRNDMVSFYPDDKLDKLPYYNQTYDNLYYFANILKKLGYDIDYIRTPPYGQEVEVIEIIDHNTISNTNGLRDYADIYNNLVHIRWNYEGDDNKYDAIVTLDDITKKPNIKESYIKIGRLVRNILTKAGIEFTNSEIEEFVNKYKSYIDLENNMLDKFEIVKGEDIRKYYLVDNYESEKGTLGNSCMRHKKCQKFLDIYVKEDSVSLIILKNDDSKILGRALLWDLNNKDGKFMDRIYTTKDFYIELFKEYAIKNNFYYRNSQSYDNPEIFYDKNQLSEDDSKIIIKLSDTYNYYPYMDTLKYFDSYEKLLSNKKIGDLILTDTNGGDGSCSSCGGSGYFECDDCEDGMVDCDYCDLDLSGHPSGYKDCDNCDEGEVSCEDCYGVGNIGCDPCQGEGCGLCNQIGFRDCESCINGTNKCKDCDNGKVKCDDCKGSGKQECYYCSGRGERLCYDCN